MPVGGSSLKEWVSKRFLSGLGLPEFHLYDRDLKREDGTYPYGAACAEVNERGNGHSARLTAKREMEDYLHPAAIDRVLKPVAGVAVRPEVTDDCDVVAAISACLSEGSEQRRTSLRRRTIKSWLNREVAAAMTIDELRERDPGDEVLGWLLEIAGHLTEVR